LVKKGVLKQADAQKIKAESAHSGSAGNSKIKLNESVKELSLYGDLRLRWQHSQGTLQVPLEDNSFQNQSARFRLLIGGNFKLTDGVTAGVELATQSAANQRYTTLGKGGNDYNLGISKAFIGWNPSKEFSVTAGRQSMPFYSTEMVWDNDVRLDGVTEKIDLGALLGLGDGLHLHFISGQFVGGDNLSFNAASENNRDGWLFQSQLKAVADLGGAKLTFAPGFQWSSSSASAGLAPDINGFGTPAGILNNVPATTASQDAFAQALGYADADALKNNLGATGYLNETRILLAPGDISFDLAGTKAKFLWDFAYNFGASAKPTANARLNPDNSAATSKTAWLLGVQLGENKNAGDFSVFANYRQIGAGALNAFYSDSDFALSLPGNQRGIKVGAKYNLTKNATLTGAYVGTSNINNKEDGKLETLSWLNSSQMVTIDLGLKF